VLPEKNILAAYSFNKDLMSKLFRFEFAHDFDAPKVYTRFPGAAHQQAINEISASHSFEDSYKLQRFVNLKKSKGNFLVDSDGNVVLDLHTNLALGYNHDDLINARDTDLYDRFVQGRIDLSTMPSHDVADILRENMMPVAPNGLKQVHLTDGSITAANEAAMSIAFLRYAEQHKRDYAKLSVLGFEHGSHGNSVATLSCSDEAVNTQNISTFDWPVAPLPNLKYPLA